MKTQIESLHFIAESNLLDHIEKKIAPLDNHFPGIEHCKVVLNHNKSSKNKNKLLEISINIPGATLFAKEQSETFEIALTTAVEKIRKQLENHKRKFPMGRPENEL